MLFLADHGYRCIAHDRRGHGRSSQPWDGNDMNTYADDLAALVKTLNLKDAIHVGHSTGGGEVARYIGRHGTSRVAKAVLISAVPPLMLKTDANPGGLADRGVRPDPDRRAGRSLAVFQGLEPALLRLQPARRQSLRGRPGLLLAAGHVARTSRPPTTASRRSPRRTSPRTSRSSTCRRSSSTATTIRSSRSTPPPGSPSSWSRTRGWWCTKGAPHGMCTTLKDRVNQELLAFFKEGKPADEASRRETAAASKR